MTRIHVGLALSYVKLLLLMKNTLTDKRKDTEYFTILFYKMQEDILFGTSKSYACCFLSRIADFEPRSVKRNVGISIRRNCMTCRISHFSGVCKIIDVMEREKSKTSKVHQAFKTNQIQGVLMLAQSTKLTLTQRSNGKHALLTLTINLLFLRCSTCLPIIILHIFTKCVKYL